MVFATYQRMRAKGSLGLEKVLREVFVIESSIALDIISERTLFYYFFTSCAFLYKFCRADTIKGFGRTRFTTFPMSVSPKYSCDWWWIYASWILSTFLKMLFAPSPVSIINARRPQPYLLDRLIKWYIMSLLFLSEIFNL